MGVPSLAISALLPSSRVNTANGAWRISETAQVGPQWLEPAKFFLSS
jgi:hypothetical protein